MNISWLKKQFPKWTWKATHDGKHWEFAGKNKKEIVTVKARAVLCGPADDDIAMVWVVDNTHETVDFVEWQAREAQRSVSKKTKTKGKK